MKVDCGLTDAEKWEAFKANLEWHRFFAIWPRRVGSRDCRFLETVERRAVLKHCTATTLDDYFAKCELPSFESAMKHVSWEYRPASPFVQFWEES